MKWTLGIGGALAGFVGMAVCVISIDIWTPDWLGGYELLMQAALVIFVAGMFGGLGFVVGCLIDLCRWMLSRERPEPGAVRREMSSGRRFTRAALLSGVVVLVLLCVAVVAIVGGTVPEGALEGYPQLLPPREVKMVFRQVTGRRLPASAANLRAILGNGRPGAIIVRFEADQQGQDEVAAMFAGQGVVFRELDASEMGALKQPSSTFFGEAKAWQDGLGIDLYVPASIRSARAWEGILKTPTGPGHAGYDVRYQVLIDADSGVVYLFAASQRPD